MIDQEAPLVAALRSDDHAAFAEQVQHHRRALHVHCYRMLGSIDDAEDVVQETLLRAWRHRRRFEGRSSFRAWLYRIATNACIDSMRAGKRRVLPHHIAPANVPPEQMPPSPEQLWLQPYPDRLLDELQASSEDPEAEVVARETIELTFIAALKLLTPRQWAVLLGARCPRVVGGRRGVATWVDGRVSQQRAATRSRHRAAQSTVRPARVVGRTQGADGAGAPRAVHARLRAGRCRGDRRVAE
jgi:RNA polymerase sigma-70 factor (ECF subfamily)